MCLLLRNAQVVNTRCLRRKEVIECLPQVPMKVVAQRMDEVVICWRKFQGIRWVVQCLSAKCSYGILGLLRHMRTSIVVEEHYRLAIN